MLVRIVRPLFERFEVLEATEGVFRPASTSCASFDQGTIVTCLGWRTTTVQGGSGVRALVSGFQVSSTGCISGNRLWPRLRRSNLLDARDRLGAAAVRLRDKTVLTVTVLWCQSPGAWRGLREAEGVEGAAHLLITVHSPELRYLLQDLRFGCPPPPIPPPPLTRF